MKGRRGCEVVTCPNPEPPKKRNRTVSNNHSLNASVNVKEPLPPGEVLTDVTQKQWRIGKPIGCGSFGDIYLASDDINEEVTPSTARYVLKIEPHSNGPLFVELHCLIRTARHSMIKKWQVEKRLKSLGMPHFIANGSHFLDETRYRFLVLPRYDMDLQKLSRSMNFGRIHPRNVLVLAAQIIDVLEYLHAQGYTHSDIKSSNLMVGFYGSQFKDQRTFRYSLPESFVKSDSSGSECSTKKGQNRSNKQNFTYSGYYEDEDFELNNMSESSSYEDSEDDTSREQDKKAIRNKQKNRTPRNKKVFNLRRLRMAVNYGDGQSSICSDDSYQRLVKSSRDKTDLYSSDEGFHEGTGSKRSSESNDHEVDYFEEAILTQSAGQVYLLDYGLASKFVNCDGTHKEFGMDQRKAHDGTLEYSSRDSHIGAHSRRSDLENLGFNILDWLTGSLPWKTTNIMENPDLVHAVKKNYMNDTKRFLEACFKTPSYPTFLERYFDYITRLEFTQEPDYGYCKSLFVNEFVSCHFGTEKDMTLNFSNDTNTSQQKKKINYSKKVGNKNRGSKNTSPDFLKRSGITKPSGRENFIMNSWENNMKMDLLREGLSLSNDGNRKPCTSRNFYVSDAILIQKLRQSLLPVLETPSKKFSPKNLRSKKTITKKKKKGAKNKRSSIGKFGNFLGSGKQYTWAEILAGNPEDIIRKVDKEKSCQTETSSDKKPRSRKVSNASEVSLPNDVNASPNLLRKDFLYNRNPTYAMKEVVANYKRKILGKPGSKTETNDSEDSNDSGYTYAMLHVLRNKEKRVKKEKILEEKEMKRLKSEENSKNRKVVNKANRTAASCSSDDTCDTKRNGRKRAVVSPKKNTRHHKEDRGNDNEKAGSSCNSVQVDESKMKLIKKINDNSRNNMTSMRKNGSSKNIVNKVAVVVVSEADVCMKRGCGGVVKRAQSSRNIPYMNCAVKVTRVNVAAAKCSVKGSNSKVDTVVAAKATNTDLEETEKTNNRSMVKSVKSKVASKPSDTKKASVIPAAKSTPNGSGKAKQKTTQPRRVIATRSKMLRRMP